MKDHSVPTESANQYNLCSLHSDGMKKTWLQAVRDYAHLLSTLPRPHR